MYILSRTTTTATFRSNPFSKSKSTSLIGSVAAPAKSTTTSQGANPFFAKTARAVDGTSPSGVVDSGEQLSSSGGGGGGGDDGGGVTATMTASQGANPFSAKTVRQSDTVSSASTESVPAPTPVSRPSASTESEPTVKTSSAISSAKPLPRKRREKKRTGVKESNATEANGPVEGGGEGVERLKEERQKAEREERRKKGREERKKEEARVAEETRIEQERERAAEDARAEQKRLVEQQQRADAEERSKKEEALRVAREQDEVRQEAVKLEELKRIAEEEITREEQRVAEAAQAKEKERLVVSFRRKQTEEARLEAKGLEKLEVQVVWHDTSAPLGIEFVQEEDGEIVIDRVDGAGEGQKSNISVGAIAGQTTQVAAGDVVIAVNGDYVSGWKFRDFLDTLISIKKASSATATK
jgi:hypothetical protein